jgi:glycosyltransferase involved in cell wall biosynthesis
MEPDRQWEPDWTDLNVVVQKNWTFVKKWRHSKGFAEDNFIHVPTDTLRQLRRLKPDIVFSFELGMRTLLSTYYRGSRNTVPIVAVGNMSELIESERGLARRLLRRWLRRRVDYFTYNGPSCKRYLASLGVNADKMFPLPYYYDTEKVYRGEKQFSHDGVMRLVFSGNLNPRKGIRQMMTQLCDWASRNQDRQLLLTVCGTGSEVTLLQTGIPSNLRIDLRGHCNDDQLRDAYARADICIFPSLADEWGLVPVEAFGSGLPVLGSVYSQSIEVLARENSNGWYFKPDDPADFAQALDKALAVSPAQLAEMSLICRETIAGITAERCADYFCDVILAAKRNEHE